MERFGMDECDNTDQKKKVLKITIIVLAILLVLAIVGLTVYFCLTYKNIKTVEEPKAEQEETMVVDLQEPEPKSVQIYSGDQRPVAVMIDNNVNAWPQYSLNKAYAVYEILVEAGETRLMALFKNADVDAIGPIRSSRHYFLDYALENDAIYAHLGWSPQAQSDISSMGVNNINGQVYDTGRARTETSKYWRDTSRYAPHNAFASLTGLYEIAKEKGYRTTSDKESVLNYVTDEVNLENGEDAQTVTIPFSNGNVVKFEYNSELGKYVRYSKGTRQKDGSTGEDVVTKNIIITFVQNYTLNDPENKGRQGLYDVGTRDGYYITNGKAIKIKCKKDSRTAQTVYTDLDGNEIKVNDGNTFFEICPLNANVTF